MPSLTDAFQSITGARKAAMFLMGVGDQIGADLLRQLEPDEVRRITWEISALETVAPEHMLSVFREFEDLTASSRFFAKGGAACARRLVEQALGPGTAHQIMEAPPVGVGAAPSELGALEETDPVQLAVFLREEHPQIIAMILSNLPASRAGAVLTALPTDLQAQVALRMASLDRISPAVFSRIAQAISAKVKSLRQVTRSNGLRSLAGLLNQVDAVVSEAILSKIDENDPAVSASLRDLMFAFEDLLNVSKEAMTTLIAKLDRKILTTALKGTAANIRQHFKQCMSQRAAEMLDEDMEALGPVRTRDVETAQQQVVAAARQLQQQGLFSMSSGSDDYVV